MVQDNPLAVDIAHSCIQSFSDDIVVEVGVSESDTTYPWSSAISFVVSQAEWQRKKGIF